MHIRMIFVFHVADHMLPVFPKGKYIAYHRTTFTNAVALFEKKEKQFCHCGGMHGFIIGHT